MCSFSDTLHASAAPLFVDLRNLFNWNSKQIFLEFVAEYSTPENVSSIVLQKGGRETR